MTTLNLVFENKPIASEILTQPSCYKRAQRNFLAYTKNVPHHWNQAVVWVIHLYLYIYFFSDKEGRKQDTERRMDSSLYKQGYYKVRH